MDYEKLIEQLKGISNGLAEDEFPKCANAVRQATTALSTLQAENKRLKSLLGESGQDLWSKENQRADRLEAENEKLRDEVERQRRSTDDRRHLYENAERAYMKVLAELERVKRALAMMWFAYVNKDEELPHSFELEALEKAEHILGPWEKCMLKYLKRGPKEG